MPNTNWVLKLRELAFLQDDYYTVNLEDAEKFITDKRQRDCDELIKILPDTGDNTMNLVIKDAIKSYFNPIKQ